MLPLYASLPQRDQMKVFDRAPRNTRKVIVATTIAETSMTIDGVVYVIDGGFHKLPFFNPQTGVESLVTVCASLSPLLLIFVNSHSHRILSPRLSLHRLSPPPPRPP